MSPSFRIVLIVFGFPNGGTCYFRRKLRERADEVVERRVLPRGFNAIGEDGAGDLLFEGVGRWGCDLGESRGHRL
jgi:hypothetical protein